METLTRDPNFFFSLLRKCWGEDENPYKIGTKVALRIMKKNFGKKTLRRECVLNNVWMFVNRTLIFRRRTILSASKGCRLTSCTYMTKVDCKLCGSGNISGMPARPLLYLCVRLVCWMKFWLQNVSKSEGRLMASWRPKWRYQLWRWGKTQNHQVIRWVIMT